MYELETIVVLLLAILPILGLFSLGLFSLMGWMGQFQSRLDRFESRLDQLGASITTLSNRVQDAMALEPIRRRC